MYSSYILCYHENKIANNEYHISCINVDTPESLHVKTHLIFIATL